MREQGRLAIGFVPLHGAQQQMRRNEDPNVKKIDLKNIPPLQLHIPDMIFLLVFNIN